MPRPEERMYPPAYPYPQPYPQEVHTARGLKWVVIAFVLYLIVVALQAAIGALAFPAIASFTPGTDPTTVIAVLIPLAVAAIASFVLIILVLVFYLVGYAALYKGRNEFGATHARNLTLSLYLLVAAIVITVVGSIAQAVASFTAISFDPSGGGFTFNPEAFYWATVIAIAFGIAGAALVAAHIVFPVRALVAPDQTRFLYIAALLGTATPGITGALTLSQISKFSDLFQDSFTLDPSMGLPAVVGGLLGLVTFVLFLLVYRGSRRRIDTGELKPILPPVQPMSWIPAPVAPPYVPPPYTPPPQPPTPPPQGGP